MNTGNITNYFNMRAEFFVDVVMSALIEKINVNLSEHWLKGIGIPFPPFPSIVSSQIKRVCHAFGESSYLSFKKTALIHTGELL
jgi:hypothetical protein